ncbi:UNVERIFIED_CONTAM: hypothetical protein FKN15_026045 [Acipenser sinensis]
MPQRFDASRPYEPCAAAPLVRCCPRALVPQCFGILGASRAACLSTSTPQGLSSPALRHPRCPDILPRDVGKRDIAELKNQMAQILEHLSRQQVPPAPAPAPPLPAPEHTPALSVVATEVEQQDVVMSEEEQDAFTLAPS